MKVYTKTGDKGETGLLYGGRVSKDHLRTSAYGVTDEAVAFLGLARSLGLQADGLADLVLDLQRRLFVVGAELSTEITNVHKLRPEVSKVTESMVQALESEIDAMVAASPLPDHFIVPGATPGAAALDCARSIVRRAERAVVTMQAESLVSDDCVLRFLNRLSDLLFVAARHEEASSGVEAPASR